MQAPSKSGLVPAKPNESRFEIVPILNASEATADELKRLWAQKSTEDARNILDKDDIAVTNTGDKQIQLKKLEGLNEAVKSAFRDIKLESGAAGAVRLPSVDKPNEAFAHDPFPPPEPVTAWSMHDSLQA